MAIFICSLYLTTKAFDYQFKTPWGEGKISDKTKNNPYVKQVEFTNNKKLLFACTKETFRRELMSTSTGESLFSNNNDRDEILQYLGDKTDSDYLLSDYFLSITPSDIKDDMSDKEAQTISKIIILKSIIFPSADQTFRFKINNIRGFQFGDYSETDNIQIRVFPSNNEMCDITSLLYLLSP